ncbi:P-loop containing nucleoside triphosphate hydrolase protein [Apodospora peruviana]|uniref:P-loop containing nucleoside triphosphate hydrolase protein n=1 Tax=Apodospora peruviana TaxID=516989 RepID=A0AAE0MFR5_9PEZI|nr:P-loop containing nucleoside triphosphate hydrolase protein [Apodospora peruviana]
MATPISTSAAAAVGAAVKKVAKSVTTASPEPAFQPRQTFEVSESITRSYYLGHHHAALNRMQKMLSNVGLIIECRDFRVPLSSWNPLLERQLATSTAERARIIVYTKRDLAVPNGGRFARGQQNPAEVVRKLKEFHRKKGDAKDVLFTGGESKDGGAMLQQLLGTIKQVAREANILTGLRAMVVGMPNAGKSTLLNKLRAKGMNLGKAAKTGAEPGVTRKLGTPVRIVPRETDTDPSLTGMGEGVFLVDTPGVFMPYVSSAEDMLKLSLAGSVKDGIISNVTVADYLLYRVNLVDPRCYRQYCERPTNDVYRFLGNVARKTGKLAKFKEPNIEAAADWVIQEWRRGRLARFLLDRVDDETMGRAVDAAREPTTSLSQARKALKVERKEKRMEKRSAAQS